MCISYLCRLGCSHMDQRMARYVLHCAWCRPMVGGGWVAYDGLQSHTTVTTPAEMCSHNLPSHVVNQHHQPPSWRSIFGMSHSTNNRYIVFIYGRTHLTTDVWASREHMSRSKSKSMVLFGVLNIKAAMMRVHIQRISQQALGKCDWCFGGPPTMVDLRSRARSSLPAVGCIKHKVKH